MLLHFPDIYFTKVTVASSNNAIKLIKNNL